MSLDPRRSKLVWASLPGVVLALAGCNIDQQGIAPTRATLNFPIALGLSVPESPGAAPRHLFVVNSNFDLRFSDGTLMALDLDRVAEEIAGGPSADPSCGAPDMAEPDRPPCEFEDLDRFLSDEVAIGSHADGLAVGPRGERLYIPSRSNRNLTFVGFTGTGFDCADDGEAEMVGEIRRCADLFRTGNDGEVTSERELELSGDPVDVAAGSLAEIGGGTDANFVLLALRNGRVALFVEERISERVVPTLVHIAEGFPDSLVTITMQPDTGIAWMTSAASAALGRVGIAVDPANPLRSFLFDAGSLRLGGLDDGQDTRDIAFDPNRPGERAFVLARRPESLVALDLTQSGLTASDVAIEDVYEVGAGPSRLALAEIGGRTYAIASTFDARKLFVFDVERGVETGLVAVIGGLSGPFAMAVDPERSFLYLADFSVSVIRVIDLAPLTDFEPPRLIATLGEPAPVTGFGN